MFEEIDRGTLAMFLGTTDSHKADDQRCLEIISSPDFTRRRHPWDPSKAKKYFEYIRSSLREALLLYQKGTRASLHLLDRRATRILRDSHIEVEHGQLRIVPDTGPAKLWLVLMEELGREKVSVGTCAECGNPFLSNARGKYKKTYCSQACHMRAKRREWKGRPREERCKGAS